MTLDEILTRLDGVRKGGGGHVAKCPAHSDDKPSLSITAGKNGGIVMHCHAGCTTEQIVEAMGIKMGDLMPKRETAKTAKRRLVATYDYEDESGNPIYCVRRYDPKDFRQGKYDKNGRYVANMEGVQRVPFRLPKIIQAAKQGRPVFVVEGEKDVLTAESMGAVATCNAGGAGKWQEEWVQYFKGVREVWIIADNDTKEKHYPGQRHAYAIREALKKAGIKATAFIMPEGKDLTEWAEKGHGKRDLVELVKNPPTWPREFEFGEQKLEDTFEIKTLADFPPWIMEDNNPNVLIKGRWLERGGSAFWISTAGTGKSIASLQMAMAMTEGRPFAGLIPNKKLKFWIIQSEDSDYRITLDREGIVAELSEQMPEVDWRETCRKIDFIKLPGMVGADFLQQLDAAMTQAGERKPDVLIINPLLAYIGGPVTDGAYVTPFLRGGTINRKETKGLQDVLERHGVGVIIFHHTPKPPSDKELDTWMKSRFPEYQGAGASDITNWGRSFVTMMRMKGHSDMVCLTAGKNGSEIGWGEIDGARRHYLAYSRGTGIDGKRRHAWRELDAAEHAEVTKNAKQTLADDVAMVVAELKGRANTYANMEPRGMSRGRFRSAWDEITANWGSYGLTCVEVKTGKFKHKVYGLNQQAMDEAVKIQQNWNDAQKATGRKPDNTPPRVLDSKNNSLPLTATNRRGTQKTQLTADCQPPFRGEADRRQLVGGGDEGYETTTDGRQSVDGGEDDDTKPYGHDDPYMGDF